MVPSFGDAAYLWCAFLAMTNNLKLTKINGKRNKGRKIIVNNAQKITKAFLEIMFMTAVGMRNIERRVNSLRHGY